MRRSWLALCVVVAIIVVAVVLLPRAPREEGEPGEQGKAPATSTEAKSTQPPGTGVPAPGKPSETERPKPEPVRPPTPQAALKLADEKIAAGNPAEAMKLLSYVLSKNPDPAETKPLKDRLVKLSDELFFSRKPSPLATTYKVVPGDALWNIARKHKTSVGLIKRINGLKSDVIHPGQSLKIIPGGFDIEIIKSKFHLTVYRKGIWVRELKVGLGKDGTTPVGEFQAGHMIEKPPYTAVFPHIPYGDKKNNPLGTRWITIQGAGKGQYGIHGTWEPESIGKEQSKGCIRMLNKDVEWLFELIFPGDSKITIKP